MGHVHVLHLPPTLESDRPWSPEQSKKGKKKFSSFIGKMEKFKWNHGADLGSGIGWKWGERESEQEGETEYPRD